MSTRRLAAIMFTDIAGYTAMMQEDEARAIQIRQRHREVFEQQHEAHRGQIIQYYGDGTLSVFDSAIDAAACAVAMQKEFQEEPQVPLRIGIHSGDILISETEVIGDGVNLASRVESMAEIGSVFVSENVFDNLKNQPEFSGESMGVFTFKNVSKPIEVFALSGDDLVVPDPKKLKGKFIKRESGQPNLWQRLPIWAQYGVGLLAFVALAPFVYAPITSLFEASANENGSALSAQSLRKGAIPFEEKKRVVIADFENVSGDSTLDWVELMGPMTISMDLDQDPSVFNLYQPYRPQASFKDYLDFARQQRCQYVLDGKIDTSDNQYHLTLDLNPVDASLEPQSLTFEAPTFGALADRASLGLKDALGVPEQRQKQVTDLRVSQFLTDSEEALAAMGKALFTMRSNPQEAFIMMQKPVAIDSTFAWAAYYLANFMQAYQMSESRVKSMIGQSMRHRNRMPDIFEARIRQLNYRVSGQLEKALELTKLFAELEPQNPQYLTALIEESYVQGQYETTLEAIDQYEAQNGNLDSWAVFKARSYMFLGKPKEGLKVMDAYLSENPENEMGILQKGELELAAEKWEDAIRTFSQGSLLHPDNEMFDMLIRHAELEGNPREIEGIPLEEFEGQYRAYVKMRFQAPVEVEKGRLTMKLPGQPAFCLYHLGDSLEFISPPGYRITFRTDSTHSGIDGYIFSNLKYGQSQAYFRLPESLEQLAQAFMKGELDRVAELLPSAKEDKPGFAFLEPIESAIQWREDHPEADTAFLDQFVGIYDYNGTNLFADRKDNYLYISQSGYSWAEDPIRLIHYGENQYLMQDGMGRAITFKKEEGTWTLKAHWTNGEEGYVYRKVK